MKSLAGGHGSPFTLSSVLVLTASACGAPEMDRASPADPVSLSVHAAALDVTTTLEPVADTQVTPSWPDTNYGTAGQWEVNRQYSHVYLRFDLSGLPANARVKAVSLSATALSGYAYGGDGNVYATFVEDDSWSETAITWNNKPAASGDPLGHWFLWYDLTPEDKLGVNADPALIPVVQGELDGDKLLSLRLHSPGYTTRYRSREYANASQRPRLTITYDVVEPVVTTLEPEADTYASWDSEGPGLNYGYDAEMKVLRDGWGVPYLRFNLSSLPEGAVIQSVKLSATSFTGAAYGGDGNVYTYLVPDNSWGEYTLKWGNKPATAPVSLGSWFVWYALREYREVRLTNDSPALIAPVQAASDAVDRRISFMLESTGYNTTYYTREESGAWRRPTLEVTYLP